MPKHGRWRAVLAITDQENRGIMRRGSRNAWLSRMDKNLEEDGSETENTSEAGAGEGSSLASTSGGDLGGADGGRDDSGGAAGANDAGGGGRDGGVDVAGAVKSVSYFMLKTGPVRKRDAPAVADH